MLAAAAFWSARRTGFGCRPALGLQLPFSPAAVPGVGSNPGQQCWEVEGLRLDWEPAPALCELEDFFADLRGEFFLVAVAMSGEMQLEGGSF